MKWLYSTTLTLIFLVIFLSKLSPSVTGSVSAGFNLQLSLGLGICGEVVLNLLCAYSMPPFHTGRLKASYQESRYITERVSRFIDSSLQSAYMLMKWFLMIPLDCQFWQFLLQDLLLQQLHFPFWSFLLQVCYRFPWWSGATDSRVTAKVSFFGQCSNQ